MSLFCKIFGHDWQPPTPNAPVKWHCADCNEVRQSLFPPKSSESVLVTLLKALVAALLILAVFLVIVL